MSSVSSTSSSSSTGSTSSSSSTGSLSSADWNALIDDAVNAKLAPKDTYETRISNNESKITAYQKLQSLLSDISDAAYTLSAPSGFLGQSEDVFNSRTSYLSTDGTYTASDVLGATVDSGTQLGTYDIKTEQLATTHKVSSGNFAAKDASLGYTGTFTLGLQDGSAATINVTSTMTLSDVADAINASTTTSGVKATVLKVSDTSYQLVLTANDTGKAIVTSPTSGSVLADLGVTDGSNNFTHVLQAAQNAIVDIDGVQLTRSSNTISDAIDGVTFYLYAPTAANTSVHVEVSADLSTIQKKIQSLVDAYNAYRDFAVAQQATSTDGTASDSAVLFGDGTLRAVNNDMMNALNTVIGDDNMTLLGLTFDSSNHLVLDTTKLQSSLLENFDQVKALLTFGFQSSTDELRVLARGSAAPTSFALDVTVDGSGNLTSASVGGDSSLFTITGNSIKGAAGTAFEGFTFVYIGSTSQSINISLNYGVAEKLNKTVTNASANSIQTVIDSLTSKNDDYQSDIDKIETRADALRQTLTTRYANYQAAIAKAESTLAYLKAMLDAANNN